MYHDAKVDYDQNFADNASGKTNGFSKVSFKYEKRIPFKERISFVFGASSGLTFIDSQKSDELSFITNGTGAQYYLGGNLAQNRRDSYIFSGLDDSELITTQFAKANIALQINTFRNVFITPYVNAASVGFGDFDDYIDTMFSPKGDWKNTNATSFLFSAGTTLSYNSILGPVNFDVSYLNNENALNFFFSVGLRLRVP